MGREDLTVAVKVCRADPFPQLSVHRQVNSPQDGNYTRRKFTVQLTCLERSGIHVEVVLTCYKKLKQHRLISKVLRVVPFKGLATSCQGTQKKVYQDINVSQDQFSSTYKRIHGNTWRLGAGEVDCRTDMTYVD